LKGAFAHFLQDWSHAFSRSLIFLNADPTCEKVLFVQVMPKEKSPRPL